MNPSLIAAAALAAFVAAFVLVVVVRERRLDRALDRTAAGTEERYARLKANRDALAPPPPPVVLVADDVRADLPWDREPIELDGRWSA